MNESLLRSFCESSHRKLIVAIAMTLLGLLVLVPVTDDYFDKRESRRTLRDDLDHARNAKKLLPAFEERVVAMEQNVALLDARAISEENVSQYRTNLLEIVQKAGCRMRRLDVGAAIRRPWMHNDNPLQETAAPGTKDKTPFQLERHNIKLSISGEITDIYRLLEMLDEEPTIAYPRRMQLHSDQGHTTAATLKMELWLFALVK